MTREAHHGPQGQHPAPVGLPAGAAAGPAPRLEKTLDLQKLFQDMLHSIDWIRRHQGGPGHPRPST